MAFEFGNWNTAVKKKNQSSVVNDISYLSFKAGKGKHLLFLLEYPIQSVHLINSITVWLKKQFLGFDIDVVTASLVKASTDQIKKQGVYRFYLENKSDFKKYIREGETIVVPFGYSLSAITGSYDLSTSCFYDVVFNKSFFYSPQINAYVFPIDGIATLFKENISGTFVPRDSSRVYFALHQFQQIKDFYDEYRVPPTVPRLIIEQIKTKEECKKFFLDHPGPSNVAWDIETTGLNYFRDKPICITFSFDGKRGYFIPWNLVDLNDLSMFFSNKHMIGQNLKFDVKFLKHLGVKNLKIDEDTLQLGQMLNEMRFNGLKSLVYHYTPYGGYDEELEAFKRKFKIHDYSKIPFLIMYKYAAMDAMVTYQVWEAMINQMIELDKRFLPIHPGGWSMVDFYRKIKIPSCNSFVDIEMNGLHVDEKKWDKNSAIIEERILSIKEKLRKAFCISNEDVETISLFGDEKKVNKKDTLQSGMKLGIIIEKLGWENLGRAKAGYYKTGDDQLERWKQLGHSEAGMLQELRSYLTMQKTFIGLPENYDMGWRRYVDHHEDGSARIHSTYKSMLMDTMRNGCGDPNYQQGPAHSKDATLFKQVYSVPDKDKYYLITLDYSGFQMRLAAIDSEDPILFNGYRDNPKLDVHSKTGYNVFCKDSEFDIEEIVVKDGEITRIFFPHEDIKVIRNGKATKVKASDLKEGDKLK